MLRAAGVYFERIGKRPDFVAPPHRLLALNSPTPGWTTLVENRRPGRPPYATPLPDQRALPRPKPPIERRAIEVASTPNSSRARNCAASTPPPSAPISPSPRPFAGIGGRRAAVARSGSRLLQMARVRTVTPAQWKPSRSTGASSQPAPPAGRRRRSSPRELVTASEVEATPAPMPDWAAVAASLDRPEHPEDAITCRSTGPAAPGGGGNTPRPNWIAWKRRLSAAGRLSGWSRGHPCRWPGGPGPSRSRAGRASVRGGRDRGRGTAPDGWGLVGHHRARPAPGPGGRHARATR